MPIDDKSSSTTSMSSGTHRRQKDSFLFSAALVCVLPNVIGYLFAHWIGYRAALVNIDLFGVYALFAILARFAPTAAPILCSGMIGVVLAAPVANGLGLIYLGEPGFLRNYVGFIAQWPWRVIVPWVCVTVAALVAYSLVLKRSKRGVLAVWPALVGAAVFGGADVLCGTSALSPRPVTMSINVSTSSIVTLRALAAQWVAYREAGAAQRVDHSLSSDLLGMAHVGLPPRVLSVALESWGRVREEGPNMAILQALEHDLKGRYLVDVRYHRFLGGTLSGEVRELCGYLSLGPPSLGMIDRFRPECAPAALQARGYRTWGGHGNSSAFYNRREIYPRLGFLETAFPPKFDTPAAESRSCQSNRAISGVCDAIVYRAALKFLDRYPRAFAHVMSLDTHLPLAAISNAEDACPLGLALTDETMCVYVRRISFTLNQLAREVLNAKCPPDRIYVYGDHRPPYVFASEREKFDADYVPFLILTVSVQREVPNGGRPECALSRPD
jgi:hypothetical protein